MRNALLLALLLPLPSIAHATIVTGSVRDECGRSLAIAHVSVDDLEIGPVATVDGNFSVEVTAPGVHELRFISPGRDAMSCSVYVPRDNDLDTITIDVTMALPQWRFGTREVFLRESRHGTVLARYGVYPSIPLGPLPPPTQYREPFEATVVADDDTTWFVIGVHEWRDPRGHSAWIRYPAASRFDGYVIDDDLYRYWIRSRPGDTVRIAWDALEDLLQENRCPASSSRFDIAPSWADRVGELQGMVSSGYAEWHSLVSGVERGPRIGAIRDSIFAPLRDHLDSAARLDADHRVREVATALLLSVTARRSERASRYFATVRERFDPTSPALADAALDVVFHIDSIAPDDPERTLWSFVDGMRSGHQQRQAILFWMMHVRESNHRLAMELYARAIDSFPHETMLHFELSESASPLDTMHDYGDTFPRLRLRGLNGSPVTVGGSSARHTLVELWSPHDARSLRERDTMCVVARRHARDLRIVSIAIDGDRDEVRRAIGPRDCGCEQVWLRPEERDRVRSHFDLSLLPKRYLLASDGTISAFEVELVGGVIVDELDSYLSGGD